MRTKGSNTKAETSKTRRKAIYLRPREASKPASSMTQRLVSIEVCRTTSCSGPELRMEWRAKAKAQLGKSLEMMAGSSYKSNRQGDRKVRRPKELK